MALKTDVGQEDLANAVPDLNGELTCAGLEAPVEIQRDEWGIPHVKAQSIGDAFFAQGFVHAQDRLWQMEFDRRRAAGRWSEVAGEAGLTMDRFVRQAGLEQSARSDVEHFNDETRRIVERYADGVNAYIDFCDSLPIEFQIAGITAEPWEPWHSAVIFKVRHILMGVGMGKLMRARLLAHAGPEVATLMRGESQGDQVLVVPPGAPYAEALHNLSLLDPGREALSELAQLDVGSNNWAVHGDKTTSGKPLVAGDPHRALDVPNVYYQNHLACPEFDVVGYSFCGVPGFPHFAHNADVAWCITHAGADYQDLFVEKFDPENPSRYRFKDEWREATKRCETIKIRDADPVELEVVETHHGPVISGDPASGTAMTMRYSATCEPNPGFQCLLPMMQAKNVDELDEAMRDWVDPCNNLIMADTSGSIAYLTRGRVPLRDESNYWLPVPGWTGEHEWDGYIPFEELPRVKNPETGWVITANNRIVGDDYPYLIAIDYAAPSRAFRLIDHLEQFGKATIDDMAAMHGDRVSLPAATYQELLTDADVAGEVEQAALSTLLNWDGTMAPDQAAPAIYIATRQHLTKQIAQLPKFQTAAHNPFGTPDVPRASPIGFLWNAAYGMLRTDDETILPDDTSWKQLLQQAFEAGVAELRQRLGDDVSTWRYGDLHRTQPVHPLAAIDPSLGELLNPPSVEIGGDGDTPQQGAITTGVSYRVAATSVNRYIFDLSDWEQSRWIVPLGSSGHPGSPHFADQAEAWAQIQYIPMRYDWDTIRQTATATMKLAPASS